MTDMDTPADASTIADIRASIHQLEAAGAMDAKGLAKLFKSCGVTDLSTMTAIQADALAQRLGRMLEREGA